MKLPGRRRGGGAERWCMEVVKEDMMMVDGAVWEEWDTSWRQIICWLLKTAARRTAASWTLLYFSPKLFLSNGLSLLLSFLSCFVFLSFSCIILCPCLLLALTSFWTFFLFIICADVAVVFLLSVSLYFCPCFLTWSFAFVFHCVSFSVPSFFALLLLVLIGLRFSSLPISFFSLYLFFLFLFFSPFLKTKKTKNFLPLISPFVGLCKVPAFPIFFLIFCFDPKIATNCVWTSTTHIVCLVLHWSRKEATNSCTSGHR